MLRALCQLILHITHLPTLLCSQDPGVDHIRQAAVADDNLKAVEGTVIVHILLAVKQDQVDFATNLVDSMPFSL